MQPKPYLTELAPTEKHNFDHQLKTNKDSHEAMSNSRLPRLSNVSKKISHLKALSRHHG